MKNDKYYDENIIFSIVDDARREDAYVRREYDEGRREKLTASLGEIRNHETIEKSWFHRIRDRIKIHR